MNPLGSESNNFYFENFADSENKSANNVLVQDALSKDALESAKEYFIDYYDDIEEMAKKFFPKKQVKEVAMECFNDFKEFLKPEMRDGRFMQRVIKAEKEGFTSVFELNPKGTPRLILRDYQKNIMEQFLPRGKSSDQGVQLTQVVKQSTLERSAKSDSLEQARVEKLQSLTKKYFQYFSSAVPQIRVSWDDIPFDENPKVMAVNVEHELNQHIEKYLKDKKKALVDEMKASPLDIPYEEIQVKVKHTLDELKTKIKTKQDECHNRACGEVLHENEQKIFEAGSSSKNKSAAHIRYRMAEKRIDKMYAKDIAKRHERLNETSLQDKLSQLKAYLSYSQDSQGFDSFDKFYGNYKIEEANRKAEQFDNDDSFAKLPKVSKSKSSKRTNKPIEKLPAVSKSKTSEAAAPTKELEGAVTKTESPLVEPSAVQPKSITSIKKERRKLLDKLFQHSSGLLHARVTRWDTKNLKKIQEFTDGSGKDRTKPYAGMDAPELKVMKMYHDLPGADKLIDDPAYSFATSTGCGMVCRIQKSDPSQPAIYGTLYFGVDRTPRKINGIQRDLVFHRFFVEQYLDTPIEEIVDGPKIEDAPHQEPVDGSEGKNQAVDEKLVGDYNYEVSDKGVLQLKYSNRDYTLYIYPVNSDLLPKGLFY